MDPSSLIIFSWSRVPPTCEDQTVYQVYFKYFRTAPEEEIHKALTPELGFNSSEDINKGIAAFNATFLDERKSLYMNGYQALNEISAIEGITQNYNFNGYSILFSLSSAMKQDPTNIHIIVGLFTNLVCLGRNFALMIEDMNFLGDISKGLIAYEADPELKLLEAMLDFCIACVDTDNGFLAARYITSVYIHKHKFAKSKFSVYYLGKLNTIYKNRYTYEYPSSAFDSESESEYY